MLFENVFILSDQSPPAFKIETSVIKAPFYFPGYLFQVYSNIIFPDGKITLFIFRFPAPNRLLEDNRQDLSYRRKIK